MNRKPRPTTIYRAETYDLEPGSTYLNSTTQYMNRPKWWPGPNVVVVNERARIVYLEGEITWSDE